MRAAIPRAAFSSDRYLVDQSLTGGVRFGRRYSNYNGCGWIAAYNFIRATGNTASCQKVLRGLKKAVLFGGLWGTNPFALYRFLKRNGYASLKRYFTTTKAAKLHPQAGILMYWTGSSGHFVAFSSCGDNFYHFYNTSAGKEPHRATMQGFLASHSKLPLVFLIIPISD